MHTKLRIEQLEMEVEVEPSVNVRFNGPAYEPMDDKVRLGRQLRAVIRAMEAGGWWTLRELEARTDSPGASVSAQMRHLRKKRFGSHTVERRPRGDRRNGLWEYRLELNPRTAEALKAKLLQEESQ